MFKFFYKYENFFISFINMLILIFKFSFLYILLPYDIDFNIIFYFFIIFSFIFYSFIILSYIYFLYLYFFCGGKRNLDLFLSY